MSKLAVACNKVLLAKLAQLGAALEWDLSAGIKVTVAHTKME